MSQQDEERRELKPCPFCGTAPKIDGVLHTKIWCPNDQCIIWPGKGAVPYNDFGHREAAIAAWNRRAPGHEKAAPTAEPVQVRSELDLPKFLTEHEDYHQRSYKMAKELADHLAVRPASPPPASDERRERLARLRETRPIFVSTPESIWADEIAALCAEVMGEKA